MYKTLLFIECDVSNIMCANQKYLSVCHYKRCEFEKYKSFTTQSYGKHYNIDAKSIFNECAITYDGSAVLTHTLCFIYTI